MHAAISGTKKHQVRLFVPQEEIPFGLRGANVLLAGMDALRNYRPGTQSLPVDSTYFST